MVQREQQGPWADGEAAVLPTNHRFIGIQSEAAPAGAAMHRVEEVPDLAQVFLAGLRFNPGTHVHRVGAGVSDSLRNVIRCEAPGQDERVALRKAPRPGSSSQALPLPPGSRSPAHSARKART